MAVLRIEDDSQYDDVWTMIGDLYPLSYDSIPNGSLFVLSDQVKSDLGFYPSEDAALKAWLGESE